MTNIKYRRDRSSVSKINIHLVFVTKYRKKRTRWARSPRPRELSVLFENKHLDCIKKVMNGVAKRMDFEILEIEGESDHVHLLIEIAPKLSVSQAVNSLKGVSSRMLRKEYEELRRHKTLWSPSYFAISCGGAPIEIIKKYIQNQDTPKK